MVVLEVVQCNCWQAKGLGTESDHIIYFVNNLLLRRDSDESRVCASASHASYA